MTAASLPKVSGVRRLALSSVFSKSVADRWVLAVGVGVGLGLMGLWMGPMYNSLDLASLNEGLPEAMRQIFGDMTSPAGWLNVEMYSIFAPALLIYVALVSSTKAFAGEEEDRSIGLLAANPVSRARLAVDKWAAMLVHTGLVAALTGLGVWAGVVVADLGIPAGNVAAISLHYWLLGVVAGGVAMLFSVLTGRRVVSMVAAAGVAVVMYSWASFLPLSDTFEGWALLSPWHWYFAADPLANGVDWGYVALLAGLALLLAAASVLVFRRRDLPG